MRMPLDGACRGPRCVGNIDAVQVFLVRAGVPFIKHIHHQWGWGAQGGAIVTTQGVVHVHCAVPAATKRFAIVAFVDNRRFLIIISQSLGPKMSVCCVAQPWAQFVLLLSLVVSVLRWHCDLACVYVILNILNRCYDCLLRWFPLLPLGASHVLWEAHGTRTRGVRDDHKQYQRSHCDMCLTPLLGIR